MPDGFHFSTEIRVRLPETDVMGIVFHGYFFTYMEVGRMDYLRNLGLAENTKPIKGFENVVVHVACDFKSPGRFDDELVVRSPVPGHGERLPRVDGSRPSAHDRATLNWWARRQGGDHGQRLRWWWKE